jgi:hypothetical protein
MTQVLKYISGPGGCVGRGGRCFWLRSLLLQKLENQNEEERGSSVSA